jgi:hypothetical protein
MKQIKIILAAAVAGSLLAACGGGEPQAPAAEAEGTATEAPVAVLTPDEKVSIIASRLPSIST